MGFRIAVISDLHFANKDPLPARRGEIADILFERAVHRINRSLAPDVTVLLGDLVDDGNGPEAEVSWQHLSSIAGQLAGPVISLPGNHDANLQAFYRCFPHPGDFIDIGGVRFLVFLDPEEPGWNARRTPEDLARMAAAEGHDGPVVMLQHCSLFPPGLSACPFNYTNADEIISRMHKHGISLALSGHFHPGLDLLHHQAGAFAIAPALCEAPFAFLEIELDGGKVRVTRHELRMPPEKRLVDWHVHTPFAYCARDMNFARAAMLADDLGLAGLAFTEHSGQLYFDADTYWGGHFLREGANYPFGSDNRMPQYLSAAKSHCPPALLGLEADCDYSGLPVIRQGDERELSVLLGALHALPELEKPAPEMDRAAAEFLALLERLLKFNLQALAHPFRVFRRRGLEVPAALFAPTVQLLRAHAVAAEINFHTDAPPPDFVRLCLESEVKLTFGSDAHALYEVGEFAPHLQLLKQCGYDGELQDILASNSPTGPAKRA